jgi:uncharacterized membrane protein
VAAVKKRVRVNRPLGQALAAATALMASLSAGPVFADFKLCSRMSYVLDAAIAIEHKGDVATRGWFRLHPAQCRVVMQGTMPDGRILLHARVLPVYGNAPTPPGGVDQFCVAAGDFLIATGRQCRGGQSLAPFVEIKPAQAEDGTLSAVLAEDNEYDDEEARLAAIQRLLVVAGHDVTPIDGVDGPKTQAALTKFLKDRNLTADLLKSPELFDRLVAAAQTPSAAALSWCNDTPHTVMAAVGNDDGKTVTTRGWYRIEPGACATPEISGTPRRLFSFAEAVDRDGRPLKINGRPINWGGTTALCTRDSKFELTEQKDCAGQGFATTGFVSVAADGNKTLRLRMP